MIKDFSSRRIERLSCYTLVELLCVMTILAVLLSAVSLFFFDGSKICGETLRSADVNQEIALLRGKWRAFVKKCDGNFIVRDGALVSGNASASFENGKLILKSGNGNTEAPLQEKIKALFSVEKNEGLADCIVLSITLPDGKQRRIVACHESR